MSKLASLHAHQTSRFIQAFDLILPTRWHFESRSPFNTMRFASLNSHVWCLLFGAAAMGNSLSPGEPQSSSSASLSCTTMGKVLRQVIQKPCPPTPKVADEATIPLEPDDKVLFAVCYEGTQCYGDPITHEAGASTANPRTSRPGRQVVEKDANTANRTAPAGSTLRKRQPETSPTAKPLVDPSM